MTRDRNERALAGYGIVERSSSGTALASCVECVRRTGYAVLPSGFSSDHIADLGRRLDRVMTQQADEFGGAAGLEAIGDALTARCPLAYDDAFLPLVMHPDVLAVCRSLLGDYIVLMQQNGVINPPRQSHTQRAYHRDLPYQHFVSSRPLAIAALFCIDPFSTETGGTTVIPGSHLIETFPSEELAAQLDTPITAAPGSFILFDAMVFHRAGINRSDAPRRAVNQVFSIPIIAQQISLVDALDGRYADDPALARLLGYDVAPARSVLQWRKRRAARQGARPHDSRQT